MPSGFQQDSNQLNPGLFRVVWIASTGTYPTADGNDNGGISPNSADSFATLPTTYIKGKARARGNLRFRNVVNRLSGLGDCQILDIETGIAGGGPELVGDDVATSLAFTVKYDRTAGIIDAQKLLNVQETGVATNVATVAITTLALAIEDAVVRGFRDATTSTTRVYNPAGNGGNQESITVAAPDTAADILADITVAQIDGTELITADSAGAAE
jgi:hypothetical protein